MIGCARGLRLLFCVNVSPLFHHLLLRSCLYRCVWSVTTAHNLTPQKRDNNYSPHPLNPTMSLRSATPVPSGTLIHPAVWTQHMDQHWGRVLCPLFWGERGPHLTQCRLGRYLRTKWHLNPSTLEGHLVVFITM